MGRSTDAFKLLKDCLAKKTRILGPNHSSTLSSSAALLGWQTEETEISTSVDTGLGK
jgi:hypothetical protein